MKHDPNCIFCKIAAGQIPAKKAYEDEELLVFHDINPWAPVHLLVIPKQHVATLADTGPEHEALLGRMLALAPKLMREQGVTNGFRVVVNNGPDGGQEVYHLHMHVMGGPRPWAKG
ncbi:histidine triad nucleotide-binding protein [Rubrivivax gelatinosus]|uniref:Histidine triad (HIT) family protein n=1 Tax=Rubrivivax gelatinosus TaxID=28068 RepID=A0A4R2M895_RUBGE|nr:histidine triad nucleotide-binding protein [Rubrivivax gelatinosus]MBK1687719.1 histidine triad nucleotide-binding protein [Rubrivivax gelatinosus]TCP01155.1 histidine triad (HIT) family protein [Rubrivivax gelatinosus]